MDRGATPHRHLAALLVASVKRAMPGMAVVHLTDEETPAVPSADRVQRLPGGPVAFGCLKAYAACEGEWLFVDTDVLVQRDVRPVFERPFDIAVATREGTLLPKEVGTKFMAGMPFNKGAVFSRSPLFWQEACEHLRRNLSAKRQDWMGDQLAMCAVIARGGYRVELLSNAYNYPPKERHEDVGDKFILHFKGARKKWMTM